jgi:cytochrome c553
VTLRFGISPVVIPGSAFGGPGMTQRGRVCQVLLAVGTLLVVTTPALAADARAGRQKVAGVCQSCHGMDGLSKNPESPNLAGQLQSYLVKALKEYRSEARKNESMNIVTKELSDADIADIAAYYASIQIEVIPP